MQRRFFPSKNSRFLTSPSFKNRARNAENENHWKSHSIENRWMYRTCMHPATHPHLHIVLVWELRKRSWSLSRLRVDKYPKQLAAALRGVENARIDECCVLVLLCEVRSLVGGTQTADASACTLCCRTPRPIGSIAYNPCIGWVVSARAADGRCAESHSPK